MLVGHFLRTKAMFVESVDSNKGHVIVLVLVPICWDLLVRACIGQAIINQLASIDR